MLCLSRRQGEKLIVGSATLIVTRIAGNRVSIAIEAPPEVKVRRGEVEEKKAA